MSDTEPVKFIAALTVDNSAFKVTGIANGMTITLEIPESEMPEAIKLLLWRELPLEVTIKPAAHAFTVSRVK